MKSTEETPEGIALSGTPTGIRRLNKIPLLIIGAAGILIVTVVAYALHQRSQPVTLESVQEDTRREADETSVRALTEGHHGAYIEETTAEIAPQRQRPAKTPKPNSPANPAQTAATAPYAPRPVAAPIRRSAVEDAKERQEAKRLQMLYGAMEAPIGVDFNQKGEAQATPITLTQPPRDNRSQLLGEAIRNALGNQQQETDPNGQADKTAFLQGRQERTPVIYGRDRPVTPWEIRSGTVIPGVLITGINSDLPGNIKGQVSQNVYDTATGKYLLIPQGTQLVGTYDSRVTYGQNRALVVWTRLVYPDGSALELGNMGGTDMAGYAGFEDQVDNHYFRIFGSALLMSVISAGYAIATDDDSQSDNEQSAQQEIAREMSQTSDRILRKNLNLQPTIKIRPGYKFNVFVNKDMRFREPYPAQG
ncbi:TrbI/VirB10 family protein [Sedimenticola thiotaurini]|uniref:TrbI/VirB10 family protein n=1 Tax=Sedimenticola thiotaurini TaxID=1543721 RepID=UPI00069A3714|nr:TrbI/VirB10 family protein [Sedimenticola thiotaurini]